MPLPGERPPIRSSGPNCGEFPGDPRARKVTHRTNVSIGGATPPEGRRFHVQRSSTGIPTTPFFSNGIPT
eukprot:6731855-Pyramimonas_sp.AAC.1